MPLPSLKLTPRCTLPCWEPSSWKLILGVTARSAVDAGTASVADCTAVSTPPCPTAQTWCLNRWVTKLFSQKPQDTHQCISQASWQTRQRSSSGFQQLHGSNAETHSARLCPRHTAHSRQPPAGCPVVHNIQHVSVNAVKEQSRSPHRPWASTVLSEEGLLSFRASPTKGCLLLSAEQ